MRDKPEFNLEKLKAQTMKNQLSKPKPTKDKKFKFWELPSNNGNGKKKKHPRYYKRQLFKIRKELT